MNPFSDPEVQEKIKETNQRRYGVDHPMQNEEVFIRQLKSAGVGPSGLEQFFDKHTPDCVVYTGYGGRYLRVKVGVRKYGREIKNLNPDFVVFPDNLLKGAMALSEACEPMDGRTYRVKRVIELLGDYYHSEKVIGVPAAEHQREIEAAYASIGVECLVLWETEVLGDWENVKEKVEGWIDG